MASTTIKDIAKQCGVGVSTVSRAINNHPDINPETRDRIMQVIKETGFIPNDSARYLKRSETNSIALLVKGITNPFFSDMIRDMENLIQQRAYATILRHVDGEEDELAVAQALIKERRLKGIVFLGGNFEHDPNDLKSLHVPFVFTAIGNLDERPESAAGSANIAVNDVEASRLAVDYFVKEGHRNIGIIAEGLHKPSVGQLRYRGYLQGLEANGIDYCEDFVYEITEGIDHYSTENGYKAAKSLITEHPEITALFCVADVVAIGACRGLYECGKRIPEDVSVIGFDGIEAGKYMIPSITTIGQPVKEMAVTTVSMLFGMIDKKKKPENIIMPATLIVRESTGPVRVQ